MKNDLLIKISLSVIGSLCLLITSLCAYVFADNVGKLEERVEKIENQTITNDSLRLEGYQRLTRVESQVGEISRNIQDIKRQGEQRDEKLDKIIDKLEKR